MTLSPGEHWKRIPANNAEYRKATRKLCLTDKAMQKGEMRNCAEDIIYFINSFVEQYDPTQKSARAGPFICWPFQRRAIRRILDCWEKDRPVVIPKSRKMGATWLLLIIQLWLILFHDRFQCLCISKSALAVDDETNNSLFAKVRFVIDNLPEWMVGETFKKRMFIGIKRTKAELAGEASSKRAGVGGRGGFVMVDEAAEIEELSEVIGKLVMTAPFRVFISTHLGTGNPFYELCQDEAYEILQFHWTQHPECNRGLYSYDTEEHKRKYWRYDEETDDLVEIPGPVDPILEGYDFDESGKPTGGPHPGIRSPWYDKTAKEMRDDRTVAMQLDINPSGSVSQFYNPTIIRSLRQKYSRPPLWEGILKYNETTGEPIEFVRKDGGPVRMWLNLTKEGRPPIARYGAGADVSQGQGCTPSCLSIVNGMTGEKVLEFVDANIDPLKFGTLAVALCWMFQDGDGQGAKLCWEQQGPGGSFAKRVWRELQYRSIYYVTYENRIGGRTSDTPGWNPTAASKMELHTFYRAALYDGLFLNRSDHALAEVLQFKYDDTGKTIEHSQYVNKRNPEISRENHGDVVIADALAYKMIQGMREQIEEEKQADTPTIFSIAGRRELRKRKANESVWA